MAQTLETFGAAPNWTEPGLRISSLLRTKGPSDYLAQAKNVLLHLAS